MPHSGGFIRDASLLMCAGMSTLQLFDIKDTTVDMVWSIDLSALPLHLVSTTSFTRAVKFQGNVHLGYVGQTANTIYHVVYDESKQEHRVSVAATICN
jgi:heme/copper-type cytochrome/quinol oxidase subunit 4